MNDQLSPHNLRPLLHLRHWQPEIHYFAVADSTQQLALQAARAGAAEGTLFVAEAQTSGRGRHGHSWMSAPGAGIYASLVLRPRLPATALLRLTLAAGLALADAVIEVCGLTPELRWPNDLLLQGKKFCGLLLEASADGAGGQLAVLGFGINVHPVEFPPELAGLATVLDVHAQQPIARPVLCAAALRHFEQRYFSAGASPAVLAEFERRSHYARGLEVSVGGSEPCAGRTEGLDPSGFLRVRLADGSLRLVISGDVRPLPPPSA